MRKITSMYSPSIWDKSHTHSESLLMISLWGRSEVRPGGYYKGSAETGGCLATSD